MKNQDTYFDRIRNTNKVLHVFTGIIDTETNVRAEVKGCVSLSVSIYFSNELPSIKYSFQTISNISSSLCKLNFAAYESIIQF